MNPKTNQAGRLLWFNSFETALHAYAMKYEQHRTLEQISAKLGHCGKWTAMDIIQEGADLVEKYGSLGLAVREMRREGLVGEVAA